MEAVGAASRLVPERRVSVEVADRDQSSPSGGIAHLPFERRPGNAEISPRETANRPNPARSGTLVQAGTCGREMTMPTAPTPKHAKPIQPIACTTSRLALIAGNDSSAQLLQFNGSLHPHQVHSQSHRS